jgi:ABC-type transport system, involved in lipoprotein release, permease component
MTREVLISEQTKQQYNLSIGETVYVGGTIATAQENEVTVVGVTDTYSRFLGTSTVVMPPSELQQIAGLTASDRAAMLTVKLADGATVDQTVTELEREYPEYTIQTNREQLQSILADQAVIITSGASLVLLAVIAGVLLLTNLQLSFISRHRETFGALSALGTTQSSLVLIILINTMCIGILGGVLGGLLAVPGIWAMNWVAVTLTGFENVVPLSESILFAGFGVSVVVSLIGGVVATLYLARIKALDHLR